ncbi:MAG: hypothetical protein ACE5J3_07625 [Methanosarcinales archaeon]
MKQNEDIGINTLEGTLMTIESFRRIIGDRREQEEIVEWCGHADGNAEYLVNDLMEFECKMYLISTTILFQNNLMDLIIDPYAYISTFTYCSVLDKEVKTI